MLKKFIQTCLTTTLATSLVTLLAACGGSGGNNSQLDNKHANRSAKEQVGPYANEVQQLYVAYFGRPADPGGLVNFQAALQAAGAPTDIQGLVAAYSTNPAVKTLIDSFGTSNESKTLYGSGTTTAFVTAVFQNVLGRQPASAGLQFWVNSIDSGSLTQADAALSIMAGAEANQTAQGKIDAALVQNRLAVASYFSAEASASIYTGPAAAANARTMLATVTSTTDVTAFQANVDATVSGISNEHIFESFALHGGESTIGFYIPFGGGNLVPGVNYIYSNTASSINVSPYLGGTQSYTPILATLDANLSAAKPAPSRIIKNGQVWLQPATAQRHVSYVNGNIHIDYLANDGNTVLTSSEFYNYSSSPLSGLMDNSPQEFLSYLPVNDWINFNNFSSNAQWQSGAAYIKKQGHRVGDTVFAEDCANTGSPIYTNDTSPTPCQTGTTLDNFFPVTLGSSSHPYETDNVSDGTISTVQGLRMWVGNNALPLAQDNVATYRAYYELNGNVYEANIQKDKTPYFYQQYDGSVVNYTISLNQAAVNSISQGIITGSTVPGSQAGNSSTVGNTVDMFGIGAHGINGSLSPADLRTHYNIPANLDGSGQTIAIVDAPGFGDVEDDLTVYSQYYNLPLCTTANSCFQHVDLSNGASIPAGSGWGREIELDTQMVHAIAPGAKIILVTAASSSASDMMAATIYAGNIKGVTAVTMSFGDANSSTYRITTEAQFQNLVNNVGMIFFASSGDGGFQIDPTYPATSNWVTAVGGTAINSIQWSSTSSETAWRYSGGGTSSVSTIQDWQSTLLATSGLPTSQRAIPDVAAVADPQHSGVSSYYEDGWSIGGGTSVASPIWAGISAIMGQYMANEGKSLPALIRGTQGGFNGVLYNMQYARLTNPNTTKANGFYDIVSGSNGPSTCSMCTAGTGYDFVTGMGAPNVTALLSSF